MGERSAPERMIEIERALLVVRARSLSLALFHGLEPALPTEPDWTFFVQRPTMLAIVMYQLGLAIVF
jgi:hypothetical protein